MIFFSATTFCVLVIEVLGTPSPVFKSRQLLNEDDPRFEVLIPKLISQKVPFRDTTRSRIVNGKGAIPRQFPYQALLNMYAPGRVVFCGGSLISDKWVLTAGHCVQGEITSANAILGSITATGDENSVVIAASAFVSHGGYNPDTLENDIAAFLLATTAPINEFIKPIALSADHLEASVNTIISGFGRTSDDSNAVSEVLLFASLTTISNEKCAEIIMDVPDEDVCAQGQNRESTCSGDSGGPLIIRNEDGDFQVGIVSWVSAAGCGVGAPGGFLRISKYREWIAQVTGV